MKDQELTADTALLLDELRADSALDAGAVGRLSERLGASLGIAPPLASEAGAAASGPAGVANGAGAVSGALVGKGVVAGALLLGGVFGAVGHALLSTPSERVVYREVPAAVAPARVEPVPNAPAALPAAAVEPQVVDAVSARRAPARGAAVSAAPVEGDGAVNDAGVDGEVRLLDIARRAIAAGDGTRALAVLREHTERYPRAALEQERAALNVKALVAAGQGDAARRAGERFAQQYPSSMLLDSVNAALRTRTIP